MQFSPSLIRIAARHLDRAYNSGRVCLRGSWTDLPADGKWRLFDDRHNEHDSHLIPDSVAGNLATADLNKDGNGDLVITNMATATSSYVTVMLGKADGTFQNGVTYATAGDYSVAAVIDDVNGDGKPDIVSVSGGEQASGSGGLGLMEMVDSSRRPCLPRQRTAGVYGRVANGNRKPDGARPDFRGIGKSDSRLNWPRSSWKWRRKILD